MKVNNGVSSAIIAGDNSTPIKITTKPVNKQPDTCEIKPQPALDSTRVSITTLPGGCFGGGIKPMFGRMDNIIDDALMAAHNKMFGAQTQALRGFYTDIKGMDQNELDEMKDTLVKRLASDDSQWDRNLLQKMYQITDAVAEHRQPPHLRDRFDVLPYKPIDVPDGWLDKLHNGAIGKF